MTQFTPSFVLLKNKYARVLHASPFSTCDIPRISCHPHPEGEPCICMRNPVQVRLRWCNDRSTPLAICVGQLKVGWTALVYWWVDPTSNHRKESSAAGGTALLDGWVASAHGTTWGRRSWWDCADILASSYFFKSVKGILTAGATALV